MDDRDQPVPITTDVENHKLAHRIGIFEGGLHLLTITPVRPLDSALPGFDLVRRVSVSVCCLLQVFLGDDVHLLIILHIA